MAQHSKTTADPSAYTRFIRPARGRWRCLLLNLLLRITVKWRHGLRILIPTLRTAMGKLNQQASAKVKGVRREAVQCNGVAAEWLTPADYLADRVLLYIHGGAFVARSPNLHAAMVAPWCQPLRARALMVDYRLAPEHPSPAAMDDCLTAYRWLLQQGFDARQMVIAGDSAGGNLALATLHRIKAEGQPLPSCAVLLSPFVDFTLSGDSALSNARRDPIFTMAFALGIRRFYAAPETYLQPGVSPLFADFSGLPPMLLQVGSSEMLLDDATRTAEKAHAAGVHVELEIWERQPHVFQAITALPQARAATQNILRFVRGAAAWEVNAGGETESGRLRDRALPRSWTARSDEHGRRRGRP